MSIETWIIILLIISVSAIVKGSTGFGFALFSFPLLAHYISIKTLIPFLTLLNLFSSLQIVISSKGAKLNRRIILLSITGIIGVILGTIVLKYTNDFWLKTGSAIILIFLSAMFLTGYRFHVRKFRRGFAVAGFTSGFLGGSTSVSGPPLALFLTSTNIDSHHFRYLFAWFSINTASVAFFDYLKIGIVSPLTFKLFFLSIPVLILGLYLGKFLNKKIPYALFYKGVIIITLLSGILLLGSCLKKCMAFF